MASEEWGVLFPWGNVSVQQDEQAARRLYHSLLHMELVKMDGTLTRLDDLVLVRRFVMDWEEVEL